MTTQEIAWALRVARDVVAAGWCRGKFGFGTNEKCALGALIHNKHNVSEVMKALLLAANYDTTIMSSQSDAIICWNDTKGRTQQEVVGTFELAAKMVEIGQDYQELKEVAHEHEPELTCV